MDKISAIHIAVKHIEQRNIDNVVKDIKWIVSEPIEKENGWYFDYKYESLTDEPIYLGGAPGFMVKKDDSSIKVISWGEYSKLNSEFI
jgi:hypothetical protein